MAEKTTEKKRPLTTITLRKSGKVVTVPESYTTRELLAAQKAAGKDTTMVPVFLAQRLCLFDGAQITAGDILDLPGADFAQIVSVLFAADEDESGNG